MTDFGRLELALAAIWASEAQNFTPWLAKPGGEENPEAA